MTDVVFTRTSHVATDPVEDERLAASLARLAREDYAAHAAIAESEASDWPGDLAGRLLLSLSRQLHSGYVDGSRPRELFEAMLAAMQGRGYFGEPAGDIVDEQQVACHGWVVSGLLQYGAATGDPRSLEAAGRVVDHLILPAMARLDSYPLERDPIDEGAASGTATAVVGGWRVSTDTWCVLVALGALVPFYEATRREDVASAIRRLLEVVSEVDLVEQRAQLHASLAGARNFARFAELTGDETATAFAVRVYAQYATHGRTLNFATYNWFGRPDSWTEPCAIVDALGLAFALHRLTGEAGYLDDVVLIEENALAFAERPNGSFGLDSVATEDDPVLFAIHPDARWCCTMRGALGLVDVRDRSYELRPDGATVLIPRGARVAGEGWDLRFRRGADAGTFSVEVVAAPSGAEHLVLRGPALAGGEVRLGLEAGPRDLPLEVRGRWHRRLDSGAFLWFEDGALLVDAPDGQLVALGDAPRESSEEGPRYRLVHESPGDA